MYIYIYICILTRDIWNLSRQSARASNAIHSSSIKIILKIMNFARPQAITYIYNIEGKITKYRWRE